jgi:hypothetical protein
LKILEKKHLKQEMRFNEERARLSTQEAICGMLQRQFGDSNDARFLQSVLLFESGVRLFEHLRYVDGRLAYFSAYSTIEGWIIKYGKLMKVLSSKFLTVYLDRVCPMVVDLFTGAKRQAYLEFLYLLNFAF